MELTGCSRITLKGKTRKGKTNVKLHGNVWSIVIRVERVVCLGRVPGLLVCPVGLNGGKHARWIKVGNDSDFEILPV